MHKFVQQISNYMKIMKVKISLLTSLLLVFYGCEKTVIAYPGNNQSTTPSTPIGAIQWDNNFPSLEIVDEDAYRIEIDEEISGTIGNLNAIDDNPDDEFCFKIQNQTNGNYFSLVGTNNQYCEDGYFGGDVKLDLSTKTNFEALDSDKTIEVDIEVMDDSRLKNNSLFKLFVKVRNVNEDPFFSNTNQFLNQRADEGIDYSYTFETEDIDEAYSHTLVLEDNPSWLDFAGPNSFEIVGIPPAMEGPSTPVNFSVIVFDEGNDGEQLSATEPFEIIIYNNSLPEFNMQNFDIEWEEELENSYTISVNDESVDLDNLSLELIPSLESYDLSLSKLNNRTWVLGGTLGNSYVNETISFSMVLNDNRNLSPGIVTEDLNINVNPNDAPLFSNATDLPSLIHHGCEYDFTLFITDDDPVSSITIDVDESSDWLNVISNQSSITFNGIPQEGDIGSNEAISIVVSDNRPNVPLTEAQSFLVSVDRNYPPEFTNSNDVITVGNVGSEYVYTFGVEDTNGDAITFSGVSGPSWLTFYPEQFKVSGTPTEEGTYVVEIQLDDGCITTSFEFEIEVTE